MDKLILISPKEHFSELISSAIEKQKVNAPQAVQTYLVNVLEHYLDARNLFQNDILETGEKSPDTLAEMYLKASASEGQQQIELLKKLADRSLYISGYFGDSLNRKTIDIDYYAEMGGVAYGHLAEVTKQDTSAHIFRIFSRQFMDFVDVLSYVSSKSSVQSDANLLRLYDRYVKTGSSWAREMLLEAGVVTLPLDQMKLSKQEES